MGRSRRAPRVHLLPGLLLLLGACGREEPRAPSSPTSGATAPASAPSPAPAEPRYAEPADLLASLAARKPVGPALDEEEARWIARLRAGLLDGPRRDWSVTVHSWTASDASGPPATLQQADIAPPRARPSGGGAGGGADARWIRLTRASAAPRLAALHERAYLTPLARGGHQVRPFHGLGPPAFASDLDDPDRTTYAWQHGELVVRTLGFDAEDALEIHQALDRARLYGDAPPAPLPARPAAQAGEVVPAGPSDDRRAPFLGRWEGSNAKSRLTLDLRADGTWQGTEIRGARTSLASGTWTLQGSGVTLLLTHENGKAESDSNSISGVRIGETLELRSAEAKEAVVMRRP